jgi:hypothetical protein
VKREKPKNNCGFLGALANAETRLWVPKLNWQDAMTPETQSEVTFER